MHLVEISRHVSPDAHSILVADDAGWHSSRELVVPSNITLLTLPPYGPELNLIENLALTRPPEPPREPRFRKLPCHR